MPNKKTIRRRRARARASTNQASEIQTIQQLQKQLDEASCFALQETKRLQAQLDGVIADAELKTLQLRKQLEEAKKHVEQETAELNEKRLKKFIEQNGWKQSLNLTTLALINSGIGIKLWSKYIKDFDILQKYFFISVILRPAAHFCKKCQTETKHILVDADFPTDYYENVPEFDENGNRLNEDGETHIYENLYDTKCTKLHCIECLFKIFPVMIADH